MGQTSAAALLSVSKRLIKHLIIFISFHVYPLFTYFGVVSMRKSCKTYANKVKSLKLINYFMFSSF